MSDSSIWFIDRALSGVTTPGENKPGNDGNEEVFRIPQSFNTGASKSDGLVSYSENLLRVVLALWRGPVGVFYSHPQLTSFFLSVMHSFDFTVLRKCDTLHLWGYFAYLPIKLIASNISMTLTMWVKLSNNERWRLPNMSPVLFVDKHK